MKRISIALFALLALAACSRRVPTAVMSPAQQKSEAIAAMPPNPGPLGRSYAFIAFHNNVCDEGVLVVDISRPENPAVVCSLPGYSIRVKCSGRTMLYNSHICDINNPSHPKLCSTIDTLNVWSLALKGTQAYCGCLHSNNNDSLVIYDLSNPARPKMLGECKLPNWPEGIAVKDNYAYVADHWSGLRVIDVSNPINPHEVANLLNGEFVAEDIALDGKYVYVCQQGQVSIIDISNPFAPVRVSTFESSCYMVFVDNHFMYCANDYNGIQIVDVHNLSNPMFVSQLALPGRTLRVAVSGVFAYVGGDNGTGLRIVNIRDKQHPFLVKSLLTDHSIFDITLYHPGQIQASSESEE